MIEFIYPNGHSVWLTEETLANNTFTFKSTRKGNQNVVLEYDSIEYVYEELLKAVSRNGSAKLVDKFFATKA